MSKDDAQEPLNFPERLISLLCPKEPREGRNICLLGLSGFFLMLSYYLVRPVREGLFLSQASAEVRCYIVGAIALLILILVPVYGRWLKSRPEQQVFQRVLIASVCILLGFSWAGAAGLSIEIPFFIWIGGFSLLVVAQYWAVAASIFGVDTGRRIFPTIAIGLSFGALVGSRIAVFLYTVLGPYGLMQVAAATLLVHFFVQASILRRVGADRGMRRARPLVMPKNRGTYGFSLIFKSRYLTKIAIVVVLLNWIDTAGDFILARAIQAYVENAQAFVTGAVERGTLIGTIYAEFFFWICVVGLLLQIFTVSKIFRTGGVATALLILPSIMIVGYSLFSFIPIFSVIYVIKIVEAATDYSIQGTAKHALFLPLDSHTTCHAKTTIDTFFWRFGDLIQAGVIYAGINHLNLDTPEFVVINLILSVICVGLVMSIGREYARASGKVEAEFAPDSMRRLPQASKAGRNAAQ